MVVKVDSWWHTNNVKKNKKIINIHDMHDRINLRQVINVTLNRNDKKKKHKIRV
jgi:hypothetical protein